MRFKEIKAGSRAGDITTAAKVLGESEHQANVKRSVESLTEAERAAKTAAQPQLYLSVAPLSAPPVVFGDAKLQSD